MLRRCNFGVFALKMVRFSVFSLKKQEKTSLVLVDKRGFFRAKDYLNGAEIGVKQRKSSLFVLPVKLEFVALLPVLFFLKK